MKFGILYRSINTKTITAMKNYRYSIFIFIFSISYLQAFSWGATGHRIVGAIAETYLTEKARNQVQSILGNESFAMASTWADFVKSDSIYDFMDKWHYVNLDDG